MLLEKKCGCFPLSKLKLYVCFWAYSFYDEEAAVLIMYAVVLDRSLKERNYNDYIITIITSIVILNLITSLQSLLCYLHLG